MADLSEQILEWETLVNHPCWKQLCETAKAQQEGRVGRIMGTPLNSLDAALEQEYSKGEYAAFALFIQLPVLAIEALKQEIEMKKKVEEQNA